ncbi:MAG: hypothetical protein REH79_02515 [Spiroplasma sp.]|nr:hypothetical protein [Spiroplasma sp.]
MKKGLILLSSLLVSGAAIGPILKQNNNQDVNFEKTKSLDIVDLTMPWWGAVKVDTPNLTKLLNDSIGRSLQASMMILTSPDGIVIEATSNFDNSSLRHILGFLADAKIERIELQVSQQHSYANYLMAYYSYWSATENQRKDSAVVINRFNWSTIDKIDHFWTAGVKFEFELTF